MDQTDRYEIFLKRSMDCEALARSATDTSIREKCAELALAYRALASQMRLLSQAEPAGANVQRVENPAPDAAGQLVE